MIVQVFFFSIRKALFGVWKAFLHAKLTGQQETKRSLNLGTECFYKPGLERPCNKRLLNLQSHLVYNGIVYTGTSLLRINLLGIYASASTQMDLAARNFFQDLALTNGKSPQIPSSRPSL